MGKSLVALMLGWLEQRGDLSVGEQRLFDEWSADERGSIQIKDLLQMTSGLEFSEVYVPGSDATRMLFMAPSAASVPLQSPLNIRQAVASLIRRGPRICCRYCLPSAWAARKTRSIICIRIFCGLGYAPYDAGAGCQWGLCG